MQNPMLELLKEGLPTTLYEDANLLHQRYPQFSKDQWELFLDTDEAMDFIDDQLRKMTNVSARQALYKLLHDQNMSTNDINRYKEIINRAEHFKLSEGESEIFLTHLPTPEEIKPPSKNNPYEALVHSLIQHINNQVYRPEYQAILDYLNFYLNDTQELQTLAKTYFERVE